MRHFFSLLLFSILACIASAQQAHNFFHRISSDQGLSNNQINAIFADSNGYLWLASVSGLNRFDSHTFRVFKNDPRDPNSLPENIITDIFEDHTGRLWLLTNESVYFYNPETETFGSTHPFLEMDTTLVRVGVRTVMADGEGNTWIGHRDSGLWFYDGDSKTLQNVIISRKDSLPINSRRVVDLVVTEKILYVAYESAYIEIIDRKSLESIRVIDMYIGRPATAVAETFRLFVDSGEHLWLFNPRNDEELFHYDPDRDKVSVFRALESEERFPVVCISDVEEDNFGRIWVGTDHGGLYILDKENGTSTIFKNKPGDETSISANTITSLCKTNDGIIWVGTFKNGVNYYHPELFQFEWYHSSPSNESNYFSNDVNCFAEDGKGNLWIGTNDDGLVYFDRKNLKFTHYRHEPNDPKSLSNNIVVSLHMDRKGRLWVGTYQGGLNCFVNGRFKRYMPDPGNPSSITDSRIWQIVEDKDNRLWIGTLGGGLELYDERIDGFIHHRQGTFNSVNSDYILALYSDSKGDLWIGTSSGLNMLETSSGRFRSFSSSAGQPGSLSHSHVLCITEDAQGRIWVGTRNGLNLFDRESGTFKVFREDDGLPDHNIISILPDSRGNLWISTLNGLSKLRTDEDPNTITCYNYDVTNGLQAREFNEHAALGLSTGELVFGGVNGFNIFRPEDIVTSQRNYPVILSNLYINNKKVEIGEELGNKLVLPKSLNLCETIYLKYNQNEFTIEFTAINFFDHERTRYRYILEGFNENWIETGVGKQSATYTNLNPGDYTFRVKAAASDGSWDKSQEAILKIVVVPPFYATGFAYAVYFVVFCLLVLLLTYTIRRRAEMKYLRQQELDEFRRMRDLDSMKLKFFTNVSHEFRTPLTLILTPTERLLKVIDDDQIRAQIELIQRNARRLLNLVNQLLDFRKLEQDNIQLKPLKGDLISFLHEASNAFVDLFGNKRIDFTFSSELQSYVCSFDHDKIEKIVFNLLSNAHKFTYEEGCVEMSVSRSVHGGIRLVVKDSGIGIPLEIHEKIFERFFQNPDNDAAYNQGSGIGLSLCREYARMHGGRIFVESSPGYGSSFILELPLQEEDQAIDVEEADSMQDSTCESPGLPLILVAEDNDDLRSYLKDNLGLKYRVLEAADGVSAFELAVKKMPGLIVSDVVMPGIDGITLCKRLKADERTSHIPIILLTARTATVHELESLEAGADEFITKPFSYAVLELKIERLITLRNEWHSRFGKRFEIKPGEIGITSLDEKFLNKVLKIVEKNMGSSDFNVEKLSRELGVSRGHLYNKLLALTGKTPVEFIRVMRLKRAAQYLEKSQLTVSEIAYMVGFNDPKYFSRYFKEEFGMVPSEYAKNGQGSDNKQIEED